MEELSELFLSQLGEVQIDHLQSVHYSSKQPAIQSEYHIQNMMMVMAMMMLLIMIAHIDDDEDDGETRQQPAIQRAQVNPRQLQL